MNEYLITREVADLLRTAESTVRYWRHTQTGPPSIKVGRRVLYRREAVLAWLKERETAPAPTGSPGISAPGGRAGTPPTWVPRQRGSR